MKFRDIFDQLFVCAVASVPSLWFMCAYLNIPTKFFSIFIFAAVLFLIILTYVFNKNVQVNLKFNMLSPRIFLLLIYVFCLLAVLLLPSMNESVFVSFNSLRMVNWLRALAGLLLLFLPGYAIVSLFRHKLNPISLLPISVLLTIFIESTITFIAVMFAQPALTWMLIVNTLIVSLSLIDTLRGKTRRCSLKYTQSVSIKLDNESILILLLCLFQLSILFSVFLLSGFTVPNGDMWDHAYMATRVEKGELLRFGYLTYPPYFPIHLFSVSQLSGIPPINVSNMLGLANVLLVLAFYNLAMTLTKNRNVAFLSTFLFTIFGSFTFLVQAQFGEIVADAQKLSDNFLQVAGKTMQINSVYPLANIYAYAPVTLHVLSVLTLTSLLLLRDKTRVLYVIEALLIANLFLLHVAETVYVLIFLLIAFVLNLSSIRDTASLTFGVGFGGALFLVLPFVKSTIVLYVVVVFAALLIFTLIMQKLKLLPKLQLSFNKFFNKLSKTSIKAFLAFTILSFYWILFYIWKTVYIDLGNTWYGILSYLGAAPAYFMPVVFGISMFLSVFYFAEFVTSKDLSDKFEKSAVAFLALAFLLAFLLGKALTLLNLSGYMIYRELRILQVFGGILFAVVSGYALYRLSRYLTKSKTIQKYVMAMCLGFLILLGSGSTFLSTVFWTNRGMEAYQLNSYEVEALEFLKKRVRASDVILAYSHESNDKVGLTGGTTIMRHITPFLSSSPSVAKFFLQYADYIYLTKQEYATIQNSNTYMKSLINTLPVIFNNSEVLIFCVLNNVRVFVSNSFVPAIITGDLKVSLQKLAFLDFLGISYHVYDGWDTATLSDSSVAILLDDVENTSQAKRYLDFMQNGGHLIVVGRQKGYFSDFMNIYSKVQIAFANGLLCDDYLIPLGFNFNVSAKESFDQSVQITSWLTFEGQKVTPLIYVKNVSCGKLTYIDFALPPEAITQLTDFSKTLLKMLDPWLLNYTKENAGIKDFPIEIYGDQNLNGDIGVDSDAIYCFTSNDSKYNALVEFKNQTRLFSSVTNLIVSSASHFTLSVNGLVTVKPLHDGYVEVAIPEHKEVTILFSSKENESLAHVFDENDLKWYNITTITINTNTTLTAIIRTPSIIVNGTVKFDGAFFNMPYDKVIGTGSGGLTLEGEIRYNILFSDKGSARSFGDNIILNGSYRYNYPTILEIELPSKLPISEYNVLMLLAAIAFSTFIILLLASKKFAGTKS
ncbi:MAG: hypothetical protein ACPLYF_04965 [Fervidobacterium sp.]